MKLFNKNAWLNFFMVLLGFYSVFTFFNSLLADFKMDLAKSVNVSLSYYWLIAFVAGFVAAMALAIFFCKPRSPLFMSIALLLGASLSMYQTLYLFIINLDYYFRHDGLSAIVYLIPHGTVIIGAVAAYFIGVASNVELYHKRSDVSA